MKQIIESVRIVGQVIGLVAGKNFTVPYNEIVTRYPEVWC